MIYFSLTPRFYGARFKDSIILLDLQNDNYLSLIDEPAAYLMQVLSQGFTQDANGQFISAQASDQTDPQLTSWITEFINQGLIITAPEHNRRTIAPQPLQEGGLKEYAWDTKVDWSPFSKASWVDIWRAFWAITKVNRTIKNKKIAGLIELMHNNKSQKTKQPTPAEIDALAAAVDAASKLYPKKIYCLAWAASFSLLALKRGWPCQLVIGVQTTPFYAHAWAEINGRVIHDEDQVAKVLSIMCKVPER